MSKQLTKGLLNPFSFYCSNIFKILAIPNKVVFYKLDA